ncbi:MAG: hydrolase [Deltaproteobacteria bacterium]|nr:MAG: hydrolase [Deltaproteobacteria bacterium]
MSFQPHPALRSAHAQTIFPALFRRAPAIAWRRERVDLPDGDFVDLDHAGPDRGRRALVVHGLGGSSDAPYVRGMAHALLTAGWAVTVLNLRGASGVPNRLARMYHSGDTDDARLIAGRLRADADGAPLVGVGFSLGANVLLKLLGETGEAAPLDAVVAVSPPFSLAACAERLATGVTRGYGLYLLTALKRHLLRKRKLLAAHIDLRAALRARDFRDFDGLVTAPLGGFESAEDYWERCSCSAFLPRIGRPTLIIHAVDDPFMHPDVVPAPETLPALVQLEAHANGGHVGFVARGPAARPRYYAEERAAAWLADHA